MKIYNIKGGFRVILDDNYDLILLDKDNKKIPKNKIQNIITFNILKKLQNSLKG